MAAIDAAVTTLKIRGAAAATQVVERFDPVLIKLHQYPKGATISRRPFLRIVSLTRAICPAADEAHVRRRLLARSQAVALSPVQAPAEAVPESLRPERD